MYNIWNYFLCLYDGYYGLTELYMVQKPAFLCKLFKPQMSFFGTAIWINGYFEGLFFLHFLNFKGQNLSFARVSDLTIIWDLIHIYTLVWKKNSQKSSILLARTIFCETFRFCLFFAFFAISKFAKRVILKWRWSTSKILKLWTIN